MYPKPPGGCTIIPGGPIPMAPGGPSYFGPAASSFCLAFSSSFSCFILQFLPSSLIPFPFFFCKKHAAASAPYTSLRSQWSLEASATSAPLRPS